MHVNVHKTREKIPAAPRPSARQHAPYHSIFDKDARRTYAAFIHDMYVFKAGRFFL
jgi:hypothetical protein